MARIVVDSSNLTRKRKKKKNDARASGSAVEVDTVIHSMNQNQRYIPDCYNPFINASQASSSFGSWFGVPPYGQGTEQGNAPVPSSFG
jgi:hypothetical protein